MNYSTLVPSRELCEELASLGICQDGAEIGWVATYSHPQGLEFDCCDKHRKPDGSIDPHPVKNGWYLHDFGEDNDGVFDIKAPTLPRLMSELPEDGGIRFYKGKHGWFLERLSTESFINDKHLPNAFAKALIAIKKGA